MNTEPTWQNEMPKTIMSNGMMPDDVIPDDILLLLSGKPPIDKKLLLDLSVGIDFVTDFWKDKYFNEYLAEGGSKIKFITGGHGSGKTHFLNLLSVKAEESGYCAVNFSAKDVWVHDFKEIYVQVFKSVDILKCLSLCSHKIIEELGFSLEEIPDDKDFADYLSAENLMDGVTKREIRAQLSRLFLQNPLVDNNFGLACCLLTGGLMGYPILEERNKEQLLLWLCGDKAVSLPALRRLGLSPCKITKYNARHMLRSLVEVMKLAGYTGLTVTIDDLDILINKNSLENIRYTKLKREDAYESIREMVDEIDTLKNVLFVFSFDKKLIEDEMMGLKSYQALWMRIQNEVTSERFNRFTDIVDLDVLGRQIYTPEAVVLMSEKLTWILNREDVHTSHAVPPLEITPIDEAAAKELISHIQFSNISLPLQVNLATIGGTSHD